MIFFYFIKQYNKKSAMDRFEEAKSIAYTSVNLLAG
jgi:hypothetical protein